MIDVEEISAQALSDTIGAIYDCALDPDQWRNTCQRIAALCESTAGGMCVHDMRQVQNNRLFEFGYRPEFVELFESRFYRELLKPFGYLDLIGFMALRTGGRVASVHTCRTEPGPRYGARRQPLRAFVAARMPGTYDLRRPRHHNTEIGDA